MHRRLRAPAALAALVLTGLIAGCAAADPEGAATPVLTPTASSAPTAEPSPTQTPTPVMDPADPSTWVVTTSSIGPAVLGTVDTEAELHASVAAAFVPDLTCEGLTAYDPTDPGSPLSLVTAISGYATPEHPGWFRMISISGGDAARVGPVPQSPRTAEGIGLGDVFHDLVRVHPQLQEWQHPRAVPADPEKYYTMTDDRGTLIFIVDADRVVSMMAAFDLPPAGYCS